MYTIAMELKKNKFSSTAASALIGLGLNYPDSVAYKLFSNHVIYRFFFFFFNGEFSIILIIVSYIL